MKIECPARILIVNENKFGIFDDIGFRGVVVDLNSYGARIDSLLSVNIKGKRVEDTLDIGDEIMLDIYPKKGGICLQAKVVWIQMGEQTSKLGVEFKNITSDLTNLYFN